MDHSPPRRVELIRHPGSASAGVVRRIDVEISNTPDGALRRRYFVDGDVSRIALPPQVPSGPADGLWRHTCFEAFVAGHTSTAWRRTRSTTSSSTNSIMLPRPPTSA